MTTEVMTVHKALVEAKILDKKITEAIFGSDFCGAKAHSQSIVNGIDEKKFVENCKSAYQSIKDMIARRDAIKNAISVSNATTKVKIGDKEYTVAAAIEMNRSGSTYQKMLIDAISDNFSQASNECAEQNSTIQERADTYMANLYGNKDNKNINSEERNKYIEANMYEVVDPIDCKNEIEKLTNELDNFKAEVDSALSVSNALTKITVEY